MGFGSTPAGYRLRSGDGISVRPHRSASREVLVAAAIAYFEESLSDAPVGLEATQSDLAGLLAWLRLTATDPGELRLLVRACDAIDDGLAGDAVALTLRAVLEDLMPDEQADPVDLLVAACVGG